MFLPVDQFALEAAILLNNADTSRELKVSTVVLGFVLLQVSCSIFSTRTCICMCVCVYVCDFFFVYTKNIRVCIFLCMCT